MPHVKVVLSCSVNCCAVHTNFVDGNKVAVTTCNEEAQMTGRCYWDLKKASGMECVH